MNFLIRNDCAGNRVFGKFLINLITVRLLVRGSVVLRKRGDRARDFARHDQSRSHMQHLQITGVHFKLSVASANLMRGDFRQIKSWLDRPEFESPDTIALKGQAVLRDYSAIDLDSIPLTALKITGQCDGVIILP